MNDNIIEKWIIIVRSNNDNINNMIAIDEK